MWIGKGEVVDRWPIAIVFLELSFVIRRSLGSTDGSAADTSTGR